MKKLLAAVLTLSVIATLTACGTIPKIPTAFSVSEKDTTDDTIKDATDNTTDDTTKPTVEDPALSEEAVPTLEEEAQRLAYGKALWDMYQSGTLPDGSALEYIDMESAADNSFALTDIDGDGKEELLLFWVNTSMAGMVGAVFGYDEGVVQVQLSEFPLLTFYENGIVKAEWSHNQGLAGEFWPYHVYRYDALSDVYQYFGGVDAWDKSVQEENHNGTSFPTDIDVDGDGVVYYIFTANWEGGYDDIPLVDGADYENWRNAYIQSAEEIHIPIQKLTEENISALGYPKPDIQRLQPCRYGERC